MLCSNLINNFDTVTDFKGHLKRVALSLRIIRRRHVIFNLKLETLPTL